METLDKQKDDAIDVIDALTDQLRSQSYCKITSQAAMEAWRFFDYKDWVAFAKAWDNLLLDNYMGDGGTYRYRRFSQFYLDTIADTLVLKNHSSYKQPSYINTLNGDIERYYEALENEQLESHFLQQYLRWLGDIFSNCSGCDQWLINLHPYRIIASEEKIGKPTPEGLHRDGVDFVTSLMIDRVNIKGGASIVTDNQGLQKDLWEMKNPGDLLLCADDKVLHGVSELTPRHSNQAAHRDVLVVAFEKRRNDK